MTDGAIDKGAVTAEEDPDVWMNEGVKLLSVCYKSFLRIT